MKGNMIVIGKIILLVLVFLTMVMVNLRNIVTTRRIPLVDRLGLRGLCCLIWG